LPQASGVAVFCLGKLPHILDRTETDISVCRAELIGNSTSLLSLLLAFGFLVGHFRPSDPTPFETQSSICVIFNRLAHVTKPAYHLGHPLDVARILHFLTPADGRTPVVVTSLNLDKATQGVACRSYPVFAALKLLRISQIFNLRSLDNLFEIIYHATDKISWSVSKLHFVFVIIVLDNDYVVFLNAKIIAKRRRVRDDV